MMDSATLLATFPAARTPEARSTLARAYTRAKLREDIQACTRCTLHMTCSRPVPWVGGPSNIVMMGEAPGATEDQAGEPFTGRAGRLLDSILDQVGLSRSQVTLTNAISCRPPGNDFKLAIDAGAVTACADWRDRQLAISGAWIVVLLGAKATDAIWGNKRHLPISKLRGHPWWQGGRLYVPTWHPAYALRNRRGIADMIEDLGFLSHALLSESIPPPRSIPAELLANFRPWTEETTALLDQRGWVRVWSVLLAEPVLITTDEFEDQVRLDPELIPDSLAMSDSPVRYRLSELAAMHNQLNDFESLRRCHLVKKQLGGRIVI